MKYILLILSMSILLPAEMEVDGNLKVTGTIEGTIKNDSLAQVIANLQAQITALQQQLTQLQCQNTGVIPNGYCDCNWNVLDVCGLCGGNFVDQDECYITDIDGNTYEVIGIGDQLWMAENLKVTRYNNGEAIIYEPAGTTGWGSPALGQYGFYESNPSYAEIYGNLYNWAVTNDIRGVCPESYKVPSDEDWMILQDRLGGSEIAGGKLKEIGTEHWNVPNTGATNESGFSALPGGYRDIIGAGTFYDLGEDAAFWASYGAVHFTIAHDSAALISDMVNPNYGFSVRCIKD